MFLEMLYWNKLPALNRIFYWDFIFLFHRIISTRCLKFRMSASKLCLSCKRDKLQSLFWNSSARSCCPSAWSSSDSFNTWVRTGWLFICDSYKNFLFIYNRVYRNCTCNSCSSVIVVSGHSFSIAKLRQRVLFAWAAASTVFSSQLNPCSHRYWRTSKLLKRAK